MNDTAAWRSADDVDLWGLLADTFAANGHWDELACEAAVQEWAARRGECDGQAEALTVWRRRWESAHRVEFARASARDWPSTWADRCRFAQLWSYGRCPVPPFVGVAELMLQRSKAPLERIPQVGMRLRAAEVSGSVLVVAPQADLASFESYGASKQLLWALREGGYTWSLFQPWRAWDDVDLDAIAGAVFWSYGPLINDYLCHAAAFERACESRGVPIINSVLAGWDTRHSAMLRKWRQAGVPCARFQKFTSLDDLELPYPLILRSDGVHAGRGMYRVRDRDEAEAVMNHARAEYLVSDHAQLAPPDLAIEFVDVKGEDGLYNKRRAYVAGEAMIRRHNVVSQHWLVNQESALATAGTQHVQESDVDAEGEAVLRAGHATGSDVAALDYSRRRDGSYVFWESNRFFSMVGDSGYTTLARARKPPKQRGRRDRALGRAIQLLLQSRFGSPTLMHGSKVVRNGP